MLIWLWQESRVSSLPDEVIDAFVGVQKILPVEMRGGGGGVAATKAAKAAQDVIRQMDAKLTLPRSDVD